MFFLVVFVLFFDFRMNFFFPSTFLCVLGQLVGWDRVDIQIEVTVLLGSLLAVGHFLESSIIYKDL